MRLRHRVPTIFSLSMLDVLCCGLGAVILLMLVNYWDARRQAVKLVQARKEAEQVTLTLKESTATLTQTQADLAKTQAHLRTSEEEKTRLSARIAELERESKEFTQRLTAARQQVTEEKKSLALAREAQIVAETELSAYLSDGQRRQTALADAQQQAKALQQQVTSAQTKVTKFEDRLTASQRRILEAEAEMAEVKKQMEDIGRRMRADALKQQQNAEIELAALRQQLVDQKEKKPPVKLLPMAGDDRFAGVDLRGRRVVFLIDISGSMGSIDAQTPDATKWPEVSRTVVRLLRSLHEVEKFQIILFSDETHFLLGRSNDWLDFDREKSPADVSAALARVIPKGNTNMYAAVDAAFRYKFIGLDAVYVFSDGLPNVGPGLPSQPPTDEVAQSAILGKYLRDTIRNNWNRDPPRVQIHAVGFFYESPNLGAFLWALTRENGGSFVGMSKP